MTNLKIKAPINSYKSALMQINAGAGELYGGFLSNKISSLSFSGRGNSSYNGVRTHMGYEEFKDVVKLAHSRGVKVELTANVPMIGDDPNGGTTFQNNYLDYVNLAIEAGVDGVIVGDLGNIIFLINNNKIKIPITASTFLATMNVGQAKMLEDIGVKKVVLPHHLRLDEIRNIKNNTNLGIEIFGHFGCSFIESTCSMYHYANEKINIGIPCRAKFRLKNGQLSNILDAGEDCSICALPKLIKLDISSIKIIGRELDYNFTSAITYVYHTAISKLEAGIPISEILNEILAKYDFWKENFCNFNRCKYLNTRYYI